MPDTRMRRDRTCLFTQESPELRLRCNAVAAADIAPPAGIDAAPH
jgi:hypothetical protein